MNIRKIDREYILIIIAIVYNSIAFAYGKISLTECLMVAILIVTGCLIKTYMNNILAYSIIMLLIYAYNVVAIRNYMDALISVSNTIILLIATEFTLKTIREYDVNNNTIVTNEFGMDDFDFIIKYAAIFAIIIGCVSSFMVLCRIVFRLENVMSILNILLVMIIGVCPRVTYLFGIVMCLVSITFNNSTYAIGSFGLVILYLVYASMETERSIRIYEKIVKEN